MSVHHLCLPKEPVKMCRFCIGKVRSTVAWCGSAFQCSITSCYFCLPCVSPQERKKIHQPPLPQISTSRVEISMEFVRNSGAWAQRSPIQRTLYRYILIVKTFCPDEPQNHVKPCAAARPDNDFHQAFAAEWVAHSTKNLPLPVQQLWKSPQAKPFSVRVPDMRSSD